ncbi:MAG: S49 family peptidase [Rubrivivax sp.]|nr:S49 family peptidase [Rubrivivax sp.]
MPEPLAIDRLPSRLPGDPAAAEPAAGMAGEVLFLRAALHDLLLDRRKERRSRNLRACLYFLIFALPFAFYAALWARSAGWLRVGPSTDVVGVVRIEGEMADGNAASAERVLPALRKAFESDRVKALVLSIDSPGGAPLEAERIFSAIEAWRATHPKPVVAVINNLGASAAYMVALHTDCIYAGRYSLVGSVGAILSGWDAHEALARLGITQRVYASGELKSMMNPFVAMSPQADAKAKELVEQMGRAFARDLARQRGARLAQGVNLVSGGVWGGEEAQRLGLVDEVATLDQVLKARWPKLRTHEFGPGSAGLPFAQAAGRWLAQALAAAQRPVQLW